MKLILEAIKSLLRSMKNSIHVTQKAVVDVDAKVNSAKEVANEAYEESIIAQGMARSAQAAVGDRLDKISPSGTGSFSMNRLAGTTVGTYSFAEGYRGTASGAYSHAEGNSTTSSGGSSHSEGYGTNATGAFTHAEGQKTVAANKAQHVQGEFNIADNTGNNTTRGKYAHIVGNGISDARRSNAHTLDWNGLGWFAGGLKVGGTGQDDAEAKEVALKEDIPDTSNLALKTEIPNVDSYITTHNTSTASHNDIRDLITGLTNRLNALADSDDTTLDQLSEIVNYIKSNKELIDAVTTSKVNISDIVDNLTTNVSNKPLSAAQGVALKALIDAIAVPTKVSELTNDRGYITGYTETDPTVPAWAKAASKPSYSKNEVGLGNVDNVKQYSASNPPPYPVTSVNGKTGDVTVSVPTKVSQLQNDSGYLTEADKVEMVSDVIEALPKYNGEVVAV